MKKIPIGKIISIGVLLTGLANILSTLSLAFPNRLRFLLVFFPFDLLHTSRSLVLITGFMMIILADNLWKRKNRAWSILIVLSAFSSVFHLLKDINILLSMLNGFISILLWHYRSLFSVQSESWKQTKALKIALLWILGVLVYAIFGFFLFANDFSQPVTLARIIHDYSYNVTGIGRESLIPQTQNALWFVNSILVVAIFGIISSFSSLFFPFIWKNNLSEEDKQLIHKLLMNESVNSSSYFALSGDKQIFFNQTKTCFLSYKISQKVAIVLGDPVGKSIYWQGLLIEFIQLMEHQGLTVAFTNIMETSLYKSLGFRRLKIGDEAIINLLSFSISKPKLDDIPYSINRMKREQVDYHWHRMDEIPWKDLSAINTLHDQWLNNKNSPALTFSVDFYPFPIEQNGFVLTAFSPNGKLWAALSFLPYGDKQLVLELMLRSDKSPNGAMEAALGESMFYFHKLGYKSVSLGLAPLSDVEIKSQEKILGEARKFVFNHFTQIYGYKSLFRFKQKFQPQWESRYLIYKNNILLPQTITALVKAHLKEGGIVHYVLPHLKMQSSS